MHRSIIDINGPDIYVLRRLDNYYEHPTGHTTGQYFYTSNNNPIYTGGKSYAVEFTAQNADRCQQEIHGCHGNS
jgi:hypothetical protein